MAPPAFQEYVNWPEDTPKPYGGGNFFACQEDANMEEDIGGVGDGDDRDDPDRVPSATSTHDGSDDDMQSWGGRKDLKAHPFLNDILSSFQSILAVFLIFILLSLLLALNNILLVIFILAHVLVLCYLFSTLFKYFGYWWMVTFVSF
jgi:hypothetical protein